MICRTCSPSGPPCTFPPPTWNAASPNFKSSKSGDGSLLGALAIEINSRHGRLHSEAFHNFALADALRELLWERLQSIAANHGLVRLWTSESAPFWKYNGFQPPIAEVLKKLPVLWTAQPADWLTLPLRDEEALQTSLTTDFTQLNAEERTPANRKTFAPRAHREEPRHPPPTIIRRHRRHTCFSIYLILHNPSLVPAPLTRRQKLNHAFAIGK